MNRHELISRIRLKKKTIEKGLVCLLILLCLGVAVKMIGGLLQKRSIDGTVRESRQFLESQNSKAKEYLEAYAKKVEMLKEKGAFCPPKKEPSPPQVVGILGDSVLMAGKWCKVDEEHAGAKVLKIEPTQVTILWKDKEMKLAPLLASIPNNSNGRQKKKDKKTEIVTASNGSEANTGPVAVQQTQDDPLAWLGMEISAELRAFLLKLFDLMPADQLEKTKQEWANMSEEQKKQRMDEAQQMVDSGQADTILEQMKSSQG